VFVDFLRHAERMRRIIFSHVARPICRILYIMSYTEVLSHLINNRMGFLVLLKKFTLKFFPLNVQ